MDQILLVLDLDETLIHATTREDIGRPPDFSIEGWKVFKRPHLQMFLDYCFENFRVGVWTSAGEDYAAEIISNTMAERELEFVLSHDDCTRSYDCEVFEYYSQKPLKKLLKKGYEKERILAIDDTPEKWERSYGNYIKVLPFRGCLEDNELLKLADYLPTLANCLNVRSVEKRHWRQSTD